MIQLLLALLRTVRSWGSNLINTASYILTGGQTVRHVGLYDGVTWKNWNRTWSAHPRRFISPDSEAEICELIKNASAVRVVGSGHSFNAGPLSNDLMISLRQYNRVISVNRDRLVVRVQAGIRLRDFQEQLRLLGFALPAAGSTDEQSLGGLIATDVHGTGSKHAFLSECIESLRVVNASGVAKTVKPGDALFHAAIGGMGLAGVVIEVEIKCVPAYHLKKSVRIVSIEESEKNIETLLKQNDHLSFYYLGGVHSKSCRLNIWNNTTSWLSPVRNLQTMLLELIDMSFSGFMLGLARTFHKLDAAAALGFGLFKATLDGHVVVHPATAGFARRLFYRHDELEYAVPFENYLKCLTEIRRYLLDQKFFCIIEVRFAPDVSKSMIGPGAGRRSAFIELAPSLTSDPSVVFAGAEKILQKYGGKLHLGKWTKATAVEMKKMLGPDFTKFKKIIKAQDPQEKFVNDFARQLFG